MIEVIERGLNCGWLLVADKHAHARNTHDAPALLEGEDGLVALVARMPIGEHPTVRVRDEHGFLRKLECIERRAIAAVRHVNRHAHFVHAIDNGHPKVADALVSPLGGTVTNEIAAVVRELRNALPERVKKVDVIWTTKVLGILQTEDHRDLLRGLHARKVVDRVNAHEPLVAAGNKRIPAREKLKGPFVRVGSAKPNGRMEDIDARIEEYLELFLRKRLGIRLPLCLVREVECEHTEHVDHQRPLHERDRARRVLSLTLREQLVSPEVDHRRGHGCKTHDCRLSQHLATRDRVRLVFHARGHSARGRYAGEEIEGSCSEEKRPLPHGFSSRSAK